MRPGNQDNRAKAIYTARDIQELTGLSKPMVYDLLHRRDFPCVHVGKRLLVPIDAFNRWLDEQPRKKEA